MKRIPRLGCVGAACLYLWTGSVVGQESESSVPRLLELVGGHDIDASDDAARQLASLDPANFSPSDIEALVHAVANENEAMQEAAAWRLLGVRDSDGKIVLDRIYDSEAKVTQRTKPQYPAEARRRRIRGRVDLQFVVKTDGEVGYIRVLRSIPILDEAAVQCIREWQFEPARYGGRAAASIMTESLRF